MIPFFNFIKKIFGYLGLGILVYIIFWTDIFNPNPEVSEGVIIFYKIVMLVCCVTMLLTVCSLELIMSCLRYLMSLRSQELDQEWLEFFLNIPWLLAFLLFLIYILVGIVILILSIMLILKMLKEIKDINNLPEESDLLSKSPQKPFDQEYSSNNFFNLNFLFFDRKGQAWTPMSLVKSAFYCISWIILIGLFTIFLGFIISGIVEAFFGDVGVYWLELHLKNFLMDMIEFWGAFFDFIYSISRPLILFLIFVNGTLIFYPVFLSGAFLLSFEPEVFVYLFNLLDPEFQHFFTNYIRYFLIIREIWTDTMGVFILWAFFWSGSLRFIEKRLSLPSFSITLQILGWEIIFFFIFIG